MKKTLALIFLSVFVYSAYAIDINVGIGKRPIIFTNPNQAININKDTKRFIIQLRSNRSTGYAWFLRYYDTRLFKLEQHKYFPSPSAMVGAGGVERWQFRVRDNAFKAPQMSQINFVYARPWKMNERPSFAVFKVMTGS
jgi:predicted secreted protein